MSSSRRKTFIRFGIALLGLLVIVAIVGGIKALQIRDMIAAGENTAPPPGTVTTSEVQAGSWENVLTAVGSLEAVQGVTVGAELPGKVVEIPFEPGAWVEKGDLLLQQDVSSERARLPGAEAALELARLNRDRLKKLLDQRVVSQSEFDAALSNYRQAEAQVQDLRSALEKKTVRAPFAGRLGIRLVDVGQILQEGDPIVSLQTLNPIFVNFHLPQQQLSQVDPGMPVRITTDALPGEVVEGRITTINPEVDPATRNIRVQATAQNPGERLRPGMFVRVAVVLPQSDEVLTVPATAVLYAPYGNSVFVVESKEGEGEEVKVLRQQFVRLGEARGDFVAVEKGLQPQESVVTTGVFKLRNGQEVVVDNTLEPDFKKEPQPGNE